MNLKEVTIYEEKAPLNSFVSGFDKEALCDFRKVAIAHDEAGDFSEEGKPGYVITASVGHLTAQGMASCDAWYSVVEHEYTDRPFASFEEALEAAREIIAQAIKQDNL